MSNVEYFTKMSEYENVICQTPRGFSLAWDVTYVVRSNVKGETLYVKCQNMKMSLRSAIACRSQNVKCENVKTSRRHLTYVVYCLSGSEGSLEHHCLHEITANTAWLLISMGGCIRRCMWTLASVLRADCMCL